MKLLLEEAYQAVLQMVLAQNLIVVYDQAETEDLTKATEVLKAEIRKLINADLINPNLQKGEGENPYNRVAYLFIF